MLGHLTRFQQIDAVFTINDPGHRHQPRSQTTQAQDHHLTSVDRAPDIERTQVGRTLVEASAIFQDPWAMAQKAVEIGVGVLNGKKPSSPMMLLPSTLITRDNVGNYKGWSAPC